MNNISLMGRLTKDPQCQETANGNKVLHFNVAVQRPFSKDTTDFIRCVAWRNAAEFIEKYFHKGKMISLTGVLISNNWTDDDGNNHTIYEVNVDTVEFCGDYKKTEEENNKEEFENVDDDELPFN